MQLDDVAAVLASADFFEVCNAEQRRLLAFVSESRRFSPGSKVFSWGENADGAYILVSGTLHTVGRHGNPEGRLVSEPGSLLGELGLVLARPRRATVTARTAVETLFVPRHAFMKLAHQFPDLAKRAAERFERELGSFLGAVDEVSKKLKKG